MPNQRPDEQPEFFTEVDDDLLEDLAEVTGQQVVSYSVWDESLAAALDQAQADPAALDIDLYLEGGVYFECYSTLCFITPDSEPLDGLASVDSFMGKTVRKGLWLDEVAVDEENQLVLVLAQKRQPVLYLVVSGWTLAEWEELPE
ncbi:MAG: hypothetical protein R2911_46495 [Caldilineaceae bacterium]